MLPISVFYFVSIGASSEFQGSFLSVFQVVFALNQTLHQHESIRAGEETPSYTTDDLIRHYNCGDLDEVIFRRDSSQIPVRCGNTLKRKVGGLDWLLVRYSLVLPAYSMIGWRLLEVGSANRSPRAAANAARRRAQPCSAELSGAQPWSETGLAQAWQDMAARANTLWWQGSIGAESRQGWAGQNWAKLLITIRSILENSRRVI